MSATRGRMIQLPSSSTQHIYYLLLIDSVFYFLTSQFLTAHLSQSQPTTTDTLNIQAHRTARLRSIAFGSFTLRVSPLSPSKTQNCRVNAYSQFSFVSQRPFSQFTDAMLFDLLGSLKTTFLQLFSQFWTLHTCWLFIVTFSLSFLIPIVRVASTFSHRNDGSGILELDSGHTSGTHLRSIHFTTQLSHKHLS